MLTLCILHSDKQAALTDVLTVFQMCPNCTRVKIYIYFIARCINYNEISRASQVISMQESEQEPAKIIEYYLSYFLSLLEEEEPFST